MGKALDKLVRDSEKEIVFHALRGISFQEHTNYFKSLNPRQFLRLYEQSCKELGINRAHMVIWWDLFDYWKKIATHYHGRREAIIRARLESQ